MTDPLLLNEESLENVKFSRIFANVVTFKEISRNSKFAISKLL